MEGTYHQANGRNKFLEAIKKKNPEVLKTLRDHVLPIFKIATTNPSFIGQEWIELGPNERLKTNALFPPDQWPQAHPTDELRFERIDLSSSNELLAVLTMLEALALHPDAGDREFSRVCRIYAGLRVYIRERPNEERQAFLKHWLEIIAARGATEMYIAVAEKADEAPIPIEPYPGVKWSEIESSRRLAKVRAAISKWAESYNLTDPWILETVVQTLLLWRFTPEYEDRWAHSYLSKIPHAQFTVKMRPFESRKAFVDRVQDELKAFCSSSKRKHFLDVGHDHKYAFEWLALFQTKVLDSSGKPLSPKKIAIEFERETGEHRTPSAITLAYKAAAEEIGLTLRRNLRGRRPGLKKRS